MNCRYKKLITHVFIYVNIVYAPAAFHAVYKIFSNTIIMFIKFVLPLSFTGLLYMYVNLTE